MKSLSKNILVLGLLTCLSFVLTDFFLNGAGISLGADGRGGTLRRKASPRIELKRCRLEGIQEDVLCGSYSVYEDRNARRGRRIQLYIAVLPATGREHAADPVFFLSGGPGEGASDSIGSFVQGFEALREKRDIVFVDQRGTGLSNPLTCEFSSLDEALHGLLSFSFQSGMVERCRKELEAKADLRYYATPIAMDDLDDVREALGYDRINLLGISYGTRSAMVYMRSHGEHVRSAILRAVAPVNMKATLPAAGHGQAALQALIEAVLAEEASRNAYPDIQGELDGVLKDLFERPLLLDALNPLTGKQEQIHMTRELFGGGIWFLLANTDSAAYVPLVIDQASHQNFGPFLESVIPVGLGLSKALSLGVSLTTMCSEDTPLISKTEIEPATSGTFLGDTKVLNQIKICQQWPRGYLPDGYNQPISSKIPVLMISGEFDPVDGLDLARGIEKKFSNATHIVIPNGAHQPAFPGCVRDLVQAFIERGRGAGLDLSCLKQIKRTPIFIR